ncbi:MAG: 50S ribosomal protein L11 methyltransferase [Candidatus Levybacteria bacterium]|nr:50S ribosomal protein L11 methyltransferase [Candidatus Levybacteria bacterium]
MSKKNLFIPYFATSRYRVDTMVHLSNVTQIDKVADLGTGDGRIAIAFAKEGAWVDAYELDNDLLKKAKEAVKKEKLGNHIKILKKDFWEVDLSEYDIICVYPMPDIIIELEEKLLTELKPGARVLLNYYPFPDWKFTTCENNVYLYVK